MDDKSRYMRNVSLLAYFAPFRALSISAAYLTPFFQEKGLSLSGIFVLQAIFSLAVVAWEVPSGIIADKFGRARSIKVGVPVAAIAMIGYAFSSSYATFVVWELLLAIASGLYSGVDEALLCDSLRAEGYSGHELEEKQAEAGQRIDMFGYASIAAGVVVAWLLVRYVGISATLLADGTLTLVGGIIAFRLTEAPRYNGSQKQLRLSAWHSVKELARNREAQLLVALGCVLSTATYQAFWLAAPYYQNIGLPAIWFGVVFAIRNGFKAILSHRYKRQRRLQRNMLWFASLAGLVYLAMASGYWWLAPAVLGHDIIQALHKRPITARLNMHMHPEYRATMNSLVNLAQRLAFAVTGPLIGLLVDHACLSIGFAVTGAVSSALAFLVLWRLRAYGTFTAHDESADGADGAEGR